MVLKVTNRSNGADASGLYRRARLVLQPKGVEDIPGILAKPKTYPSPIRVVGADYSPNPRALAMAESRRLLTSA